MTAVENAAVSQEELDAKAWAGFTEGNWQKDIDVRDFIQKNYTPYEGDETFLAPATEKTKHLWKYLDDNYLAVERKQRVYDVDTHTPADVDAFPAGYIDSPEVDNVVVGLQTDVPCKRAMMPNGGWRMVEQAIKEAGKEPDPEIKKIFTKYRKTHNDGVFGVYTKQIKALKKLINLGNEYGLDLSRPAQTAQEAVQWTYMGYLASIKSQDGAAMSFGRNSAFLDCYIERDLQAGKITETDAQELIDNIVMKLRIVRFLRTKDYDSIFWRKCDCDLEY